MIKQNKIIIIIIALLIVLILVSALIVINSENAKKNAKITAKTTITHTVISDGNNTGFYGYVYLKDGFGNIIPNKTIYMDIIRNRKLLKDHLTLHYNNNTKVYDWGFNSNPLKIGHYEFIVYFDGDEKHNPYDTSWKLDHTDDSIPEELFTDYYYDSNDDGYIDYFEFQLMFYDIPENQRNPFLLDSVFDGFDLNHDSLISKTEFCAVGGDDYNS